MPSKGYAWLFHDVTTLAPYDFELAHADRSSISGASQAKTSRAQKDVPGTTATGLLTEVAARHILVSVTQKAKKLFVLLGAKQLEVMDDAAADAGDKDKDKGDAKAKEAPGEGAFQPIHAPRSSLTTAPPP